MPLGLLRCGLLDRDWASFCSKRLECLRAKQPDREFLSDFKGRPLGYAGMLGHFRRCLIVYGGLSSDVSHSTR